MSTSTLLASSEHKFAVARANFTKLREEVLNTNIKLIELATKSLVKHLPEEVPSSYYRELLAQGFDLTFIAGINYNKGRRNLVIGAAFDESKMKEYQFMAGITDSNCCQRFTLVQLKALLQKAGANVKMVRNASIETEDPCPDSPEYCPSKIKGAWLIIEAEDAVKTTKIINRVARLISSAKKILYDEK